MVIEPTIYPQVKSGHALQCGKIKVTPPKDSVLRLSGADQIRFAEALTKLLKLNERMIPAAKHHTALIQSR